MSPGIGHHIVEAKHALQQSRMGEKMRVLSVAVLFALALVSQAAAASTPKQQMAAYLKAAQPHVVRADRLMTRAAVLAARALQSDTAVELNGMMAAAEGIDAAATKLAVVKAPAPLKGPHASLVKSYRMDAKLLIAVANDIATGYLRKANERIASTAPTITDYQVHWRTEVIARLRRLGLTVPLWVKAVGV